MSQHTAASNSDTGTDTDPDHDPKIRIASLFCGAGGLDWSAIEAIKDAALDMDAPTEKVLNEKVDLVGVNHWSTAIESHEKNHPWGRQIEEDIKNVSAREAFGEPNPDVKLLMGGIECKHWSTARGGQPVSEQARSPAWVAVSWVAELLPEMVLFENVPEFKDWGPVDEDGKPTRNGEIFDQWINAIHSLGYSVDWKVLNAADYGDATSRRRLFVIGRRNGKPEFPEPTHSETGEGDTEEWRSAAEIIDSDESGESIWGRSRPLVENTMERIAEGLREYGSESVAQYADVVEDLGKEDVEELQERIVPAESASLAAQVMDRPYLVAPPEESNRDEQGPDTTRLAFPSNVAPPATQAAASWDGQIESVSAEHSADRLCTPYLLGQHGGATPRSVDDSQVPTITADGYIRLFDIQGRHIQPGPTRPRGTAHSGLQATQPHQVNTQESVQDLMQFSHGGKRLSLSNPLPTITTARGGVFGLSQSDLLPIGSSYAEGPLRNWSVDRSPPLGSNAVDAADLPTGFLIQYHGNSGARALSAPLPTITTRDSLALVVPDINPYFGLDIRFRMLQPRELAAAMGFPESFEFAGTKTERVRQIGNAVPVNLGRSLVRSLLESSSPTLTDYLDGDSARVPVEDTSTTTQAAGD